MTGHQRLLDLVANRLEQTSVTEDATNALQVVFDYPRLLGRALTAAQLSEVLAGCEEAGTAAEYDCAWFIVAEPCESQKDAKSAASVKQRRIVEDPS